MKHNSGLNKILFLMLVLQHIFTSESDKRIAENNKLTENEMIFKDYCRDVIYFLFGKKDIKQCLDEEFNIWEQEIKAIIKGCRENPAALEISKVTSSRISSNKLLNYRLEEDKKILRNNTNNEPENIKVVGNTFSQDEFLSSKAKEEIVVNTITTVKDYNEDEEREYNTFLFLMSLGILENKKTSQIISMWALFVRIRFYHIIFRLDINKPGKNPLTNYSKYIDDAETYIMKKQILIIENDFYKVYYMINHDRMDNDQIMQIYSRVAEILEYLLILLHEFKGIIDELNLTEEIKCVNSLADSILWDCDKWHESRSIFFSNILSYHERNCKNMKQSDFERLLTKREKVKMIICKLVDERKIANAGIY